VQSLEVVRLDPARQLVLIKGAVPGSRGGDVVIRPAAKPGKPKAAPAAKPAAKAAGKAPAKK